MSLFKKPKKNLRQRTATSDEEDGDNHAQSINKVDGVPSSASGNNKPSGKPPKAASLEIKKKTSILSFQEDLEEDEGVETFQIKKSSQSRRIAKRMERDRKLKEQEQKTIVKPVEIVQEEKQTQPENHPPKPEQPKNLILSGREAEMAGYRSDSEEESADEGVKFRRPDPFRNVLENGAIPDAAMIHAARKHRQQARELGGLADYIKVDEMPDYEKDSQQTSSVTSARLVREDENDKSDEDEAEDGRMGFAVDLLTKDKQERREAFLAAEREDDEEESDDEDDWEKQQFQKAIRQRQVESAYQEMTLQHKYIDEGPSTSSRSLVKEKITKGPLAHGLPTKTTLSAPDLSKLAPLPTPLELKEKLRERLSGLDEVHRRHVSDMERMESDLSQCRLEVQRLETERPQLSERYHYFQVTRGYVHDLADCLTTKYYEVETLEKRWVAQLGRRYRYLAERRREDVRDEASDCAIQSVIVQSINPDKLARTAEREARRRRRRNSRKDSAKHKEGLSSDDEVVEKEATLFSVEKDKILEESGRLFDDTLDEFCSIETITQRFDEWRTRENDSYNNAYVDLFLPRLAGCIVRWHLLQALWNPLEHEVTLINKTKWFQTITQYDMRSEIKEKNQNPLIISKTIELSVVPYVVEVVKAAYDPCSTSQTNRLVKLVKTLTEEHPILAGHKTIQSLLSAAVEKFEGAVDQDVFIPFHFAAQNPGFVNRQFWSAAKLLRNILHWQTVIDDSQLRSVAIDKLFKKYMLLPLTKTTIRGNASDPDTLDKIRFIAESLPKNWLGPMAPGASQLQPLIDTTMSLASNADSTTSAGRKHVKDVAAVLQKLGAAAEAQEILVKYL
ncbi:PAX3- and PAX7-binding protein 1-like [Daphnia pulicaria]|uniref:PAX3- and PAX7-binding protein 1-like n=1 Tax=Daphnia pulicaria TaxID=35523 RepID=UPI001EEC8375|nr:PAX3- and PAX7-binding protein 1-like [Daphnia pulicaria]